MPIKHIKYGCKFKCGFKHSSKIADILRHERICWYNPENKTCKSCKYEDYQKDYIDNPEGYWANTLGSTSFIGMIRDCKNKSEKVQEYFKTEYDKIYEKIKPKDNHELITSIPPIKDCPFWESKNCSITATSTKVYLEMKRG